MSWKPEVIADTSGKFVGNSLRFETKAEAMANAYDLMSRWSAVVMIRAITSGDPVSHRYVNGQLKALETEHE